MRISRRVEESSSATAAGKKPQYTAENGALGGVGKSGEREAGASPQRSESEKRLETGREPDEAVGAMQLYPVRVR